MIPETDSWECRRCRDIVPDTRIRTVTQHSMRRHVLINWTLHEAHIGAVVVVALTTSSAAYAVRHHDLALGLSVIVLLLAGLAWAYGTYWWAVLNLNSRGYSHKKQPRQEGER